MALRAFTVGCCAWVLACVMDPVQAETFRAEVSHVTDGDTLWVRRQPGADAIEIRLLHLDAPEGCQPWGAEAKQALRKRLLHRTVVVRTDGMDDYRRVLAQVRHGGKDVGAWLVRDGYAWSSQFRGRPAPYAKLEAEARRHRRGLWALPGALEPRSFRRRFGRCQ